jgi:hypothetical protein
VSLDHAGFARRVFKRTRFVTCGSVVGIGGLNNFALRAAQSGSALAMAKFARRSAADGKMGCEKGRRGGKLFNVLIRSFFPSKSTLGFDITC